MDEIYDLIGIGCGPANLALGVCLEEAVEESAQCDLKWLFLEAKPHPVWHPGLLLESASIQSSALKDLALVRNLWSRETVLSLMPIRAADIVQSILGATSSQWPPVESACPLS